MSLVYRAAKAPWFAFDEVRLSSCFQYSASTMRLIKLTFFLTTLVASNAFVPHFAFTKPQTARFSSESAVEAPSITAEELEVMMSEWDTPLIVDAYATWCV
jgi:thiol:disulfide interchange protein